MAGFTPINSDDAQTHSPRFHPEPGSIYIMDRGHTGFGRLYNLDQLQVVFIIRAWKNLQFRRINSRDVDRSTGLICDQIIRLTDIKPTDKYPDQLRRIRYRDPETGKRFTFLTNNMILSALTIAEFYRCRWQVELFFKVGKNAFEDQVVLWHLIERREDADLDRDLYLCARGDHK